EYEHIYHPDANTFCKLVYDQLIQLNIKSKSTIQSFNPECLNIIHKMDKDIETALLVENTEGLEQNLKKLTFKPDIYSPYFKLVDKNLIQKCKKMGIKVIPWTVNDEDDIIATIQLGVDGIISDYPDKTIEIYTGLLPKK
ncbi:MAG: glycerophosphodiester phosphodiesterase family protein, partial [Saprospiraceae bacterium]